MTSSLVNFIYDLGCYSIPARTLMDKKSNTSKILPGFPEMPTDFLHWGGLTQRLAQVAHSMTSPGYWRPWVSLQIVLEPQGYSSTSASYMSPLHLTWSLLGRLHFRPVAPTPTPVQGHTQAWETSVSLGFMLKASCSPFQLVLCRAESFPCKTKEARPYFFFLFWHLHC